MLQAHGPRLVSLGDTAAGTGRRLLVGRIDNRSYKKRTAPAGLRGGGGRPAVQRSTDPERLGAESDDGEVLWGEAAQVVDDLAGAQALDGFLDFFQAADAAE